MAADRQKLMIPEIRSREHRSRKGYSNDIMIDAVSSDRRKTTKLKLRYFVIWFPGMKLVLRFLANVFSLALKRIKEILEEKVIPMFKRRWIRTPRKVKVAKLSAEIETSHTKSGTTGTKAQGGAAQAAQSLKNMLNNTNCIVMF